MASEHLDTLKAGMAAFNRADTSWPKESVTDDVEWGTTGAFPGMEQVYRGPEGVEKWMRTVRGEWEEFEVSLVEVLRETSDTVAVVERIWGRGRGSGAEGEMTLAAIYRFNSDGKIVERQAFTAREEALAAL